MLEEGWEVTNGRIPCEPGQIRKEAAIVSIVRVICGLPPLKEISFISKGKDAGLYLNYLLLLFYFLE